LSDVTDHTTINVNILTHLEKRRVEYLVKEEGESFNDAKISAQSEILAIFGIDVDNMDDSESLDFIDDSESNAALIAISVILQGELGVGDLTELLATISNEIREDGVFHDEDILDNLRENTLDLNLQDIRNNLEERYADLGVEVTIPDFEHFVDMFLSHTATEPTATTTAATDITTESATLNGMVNPGSSETEVIFEYEEVDNKGEVKSTKQVTVDLNQTRNSESGSKNNKKTEKSDYNHSATADQSPLNGAIDQEVSVGIEGLSPGTTYRFRITAENEVGVIHSDDNEFTTLGTPPTSITEQATEITLENAVLNASVNPNHLETTVIFEWGLTDEYGNEVVAEQSPIEGSTNVSVSALIDDLDPGTTYHFRVMAENELGVSYGTEKMFKTYSEDDPQDIDGNYYRTVIIGDQKWMAENLRVTKYNNGNAIPTGLSNTEWGNTTSGAYAIYNNDDDMLEAYGKLYNWYAVDDDRGLCPEGWSIPSDDDWTQLVDYVVSQEYPNEADNPDGAGNALKSCQQVDSPLGDDCDTSEHPRWDFDSTHSGFDEVGFSALPGGRRWDNGDFNRLGNRGAWWASNQGSGAIRLLRMMESGVGNLHHYVGNKRMGLSVRCIRD